MALKGKARRYLVVAGVAAVVLAGVGAIAARGGSHDGSHTQEAAAQLDFMQNQLTQLRQEHLAYDLALPGSVQALSQATVRAKLGAVVEKVFVREGDPVRAGELLAEFDTEPLRAMLAERDATLASARAQLDQAQKTREANAQLVRQSFITQNAFDAADANYQAQSANVQAASAQLAQIRLQLADTTVRAPISGFVARRYVQAGEKVGVDSQLFSIVDLSRLEVQAHAAAVDVARVIPGARAQVEIEGLSEHALAGRVERINPSADPGSRVIDLYVSFPNEHNRARTGMFASVRLHLPAERAVGALPASAVQSEGGQSIVWTIEKGRLARHVVSTGRRDEQRQLVEIIGGIDATQSVLATRFDNLHEGAAARVLAKSDAAHVL